MDDPLDLFAFLHRRVAGAGNQHSTNVGEFGLEALGRRLAKWGWSHRTGVGRRPSG